jgi:hypothetical protein
LSLGGGGGCVCGRYNPKFSSTLVAASTSGAFQFYDVGEYTYPQYRGFGGKDAG